MKKPTDFISIKGRRIDLNRINFYIIQNDGIIVRFYYKRGMESIEFDSKEECAAVIAWIDKRKGVTHVEFASSAQLLVNGEIIPTNG